MKVRILPEAEEELFQTAQWYEDRECGIGIKLLQAFEESQKTLATNADRLPRLETFPDGRDIRRTFLRRFPIMVVCEILVDEVVILAVAHASRKPHFWFNRKD